MYKSFVIILLGLSGTGKSHLVSLISQDNNYNINRLIAITTRPKRPNEIDGVDKIFISEKQFRIAQKNGFFLFDNLVYGAHYAYRSSDFYSGDTYICELYWRKYLDFKYALGRNCISVYIKPSNIHLLEKALIQREGDFEKAKIRICNNNNDEVELSELERQKMFDYVFVNDYTQKSDKKFQLLIDKIIVQIEGELT